MSRNNGDGKNFVPVQKNPMLEHGMQSYQTNQLLQMLRDRNVTFAKISQDVEITHQGNTFEREAPVIILFTQDAVDEYEEIVDWFLS